MFAVDSVAADDSVDAVDTDDDSAVEVSVMNTVATDVTIDVSGVELPAVDSVDVDVTNEDSAVAVSAVESVAAADTDDV